MWAPWLTALILLVCPFALLSCTGRLHNEAEAFVDFYNEADELYFKEIYHPLSARYSNPWSKAWRRVGLDDVFVSCKCKTLAVVTKSSALFKDFEAFFESKYQEHRPSKLQPRSQQRLEKQAPGVRPAPAWVPEPPQAKERFARRLSSSSGETDGCPTTGDWKDTKAIARQFASESDLDRWVGAPNYGSVERDSADPSTDRLCGAIVFENDPNASEPRITIRVNESMDDVPRDLLSQAFSEGSPGHQGLGGHTDPEVQARRLLPGLFLSMQHLAQTFLATRRGVPKNDPVFASPRFLPLPAVKETSARYVGQFMQEFVVEDFITMILMFGPLVASIAYHMARERRLKQADLMHMAGLNDHALLASWLLLYISLNVVSSALLAKLVQSVFFTTIGTERLWIMFLLYSNALVGLGSVAASIATSEQAAALTALLLFFAEAYLPVELSLTNHSAGRFVKMLEAVLMPPVGFSMYLETLAEQEHQSIQVPHMKMQSLSEFQCAVALWLSFWLHVLLYYYFDEVLPWRSSGSPRPPWFVCLPSFWREVCGLQDPQPAAARAFYEEVGTPADWRQPEDEQRLETMRSNGMCVRVRGLSKSFANAFGTPVTAVRDVSFTMYEDECFCLLGHNGAGKTTTMMMITGCLTPTHGQIIVRGHRIPEELQAVRTSVGLCPQHTILWEELTCADHLLLFGRINGMRRGDIMSRGAGLLRGVGLVKDVNTSVRALSGGTSRKLAVALAFLHKPYLVVLDEPSAGMDPVARRGLWDTLRLWRTEHIICLTTHFMDEAEALADRVAIMSSGEIACSGTSQFLKRKFGCGYILSIVKKRDWREANDIIVAFLERHVDNVEVQSAIGKELVLQLPFSEVRHFAHLFRALDERKDDLLIESYGTSITNLEEVFLKVAAMHGKQIKEARRRSSTRRSPEAPLNSMSGPPELSETMDIDIESLRGESLHDPDSLMGRRRLPPFLQLLWLQSRGLFIRRVKFAMRNRKAVICQLLLPLTMVLLMCSWAGSVVYSQPELEMTTEHWNLHTSKGPRVPLQIGVPKEYHWSVNQTGFSMAGRDQAARWKGMTDGVKVKTLSNFTGKYGQDNVVSKAVELEAGAFAKECWRGRSNLWSASQHGAIMYPSSGQRSPKELVSPREFEWHPVIFHNVTDPYAMPTLYKLHAEAQLKAQPDNPIRALHISSHPLPPTHFDKAEAIASVEDQVVPAILVGFSLIPAGIAGFIVYEREKKVKNQLLISGCSILAYWLSNYVFDVLFSLLPALGTWLFFQLSTTAGASAYAASPAQEAILALFVSYAFAAPVMAYLLSFPMRQGGLATVVVWVGSSSLGFAYLECMKAFEDSSGYLVAKWLGRLLPVNMIGSGFTRISKHAGIATSLDVGALSGRLTGGERLLDGDPCPADATDMDCKIFMVGDEFLIMMLEWIPLLLLVVLIDHIISFQHLKKIARAVDDQWCMTAQTGDEMVQAEAVRVAGLDPQGQCVYVKEVHKVYKGAVHAVRGVSFAACEGQVFGLLGVNGAGKTTTFKMLCGEEAPSEGDIRIQGIDVTAHPSQARQYIGYCPQSNSLIESMTTLEHLYLYGRLKGLHGTTLHEAVESCLSDLDLHSFIFTRAGELSGGNQRKVSVAMATIGEPPMVFLDEPSAGMDPVARRGMWTVLQDIADKRKKSVVILTTHSMEEAEALCCRIAIQVEGQFRCLGTPQQIKTNYGHGLELNVRFAYPTREEMQATLQKLGFVSDQCIPARVALQAIGNVCGSEVAAELQSRPGSPLEATASTCLVMPSAVAEWTILIQRAQAFEELCAADFEAESMCADEDLPVFVLVESTLNIVRYQIKSCALQGKYKSIGAIFSLLQDHQEQLFLEDFQVTQTTLDQIFNSFAKSHAKARRAQAEGSEEVEEEEPAAVAAVEQVEEVLHLPQQQQQQGQLPLPAQQIGTGWQCGAPMMQCAAPFPAAAAMVCPQPMIAQPPPEPPLVIHYPSSVSSGAMACQAVPAASMVCQAPAPQPMMGMVACQTPMGPMLCPAALPMPCGQEAYGVISQGMNSAGASLVFQQPPVCQPPVVICPAPMGSGFCEGPAMMQAGAPLMMQWQMGGDGWPQSPELVMPWQEPVVIHTGTPPPSVASSSATAAQAVAEETHQGSPGRARPGSGGGGGGGARERKGKGVGGAGAGRGRRPQEEEEVEKERRGARGQEREETERRARSPVLIELGDNDCGKEEEDEEGDAVEGPAE